MYKAILDISNLSYTYEKADTKALENVTLSIRQGKFIAIMGETGAGKSTLLMTLNGLIPQFMEGKFEGRVVVDQTTTLHLPIQHLIQKIGMVLQDPETQIFGLNVWEDVAFGPSNLGIHIDEIHQRVDEALELVGLHQYHERMTQYLSGGEKQRLAVAGVLAIDPNILALDEPTSELDPEGKNAIFHIIKKLQEECGMTIIIAEHESEKILAYADEVHVLKKGQLVWSGHPEDLFADEKTVRELNLRPPGIARLFWDLKKRGLDLGQVCPRTVDETCSLLKDKLLSSPKSMRNIASQRKENRIQINKTPGAVNETILRVKDLYHTYTNGHEAIKGISLDVHKGDYIAMIGQNGAGKSTFCKHLNGLLKPTGGAVHFKGEDLAKKNTSELAHHIGYVFQNPDHQIFCTTVIEEVKYGLKMKGLPEHEQVNKAMEVLTIVGLEDMAEKHPFSLGKGLRQRLAVASILALEPEMIIIDEPTTGQDWTGTERMLSLLRKLHQKGHTLIVITHNMQIATEEAKRVVIMGGGKIVKDCTPFEIFTDLDVLASAHIRPTQIASIANHLSDYLENSSYLTSSSELSDAIAERIGVYA